MKKLISSTILTLFFIASCSNQRHIINGDNNFNSRYYEEAAGDYKSALLKSNNKDEKTYLYKKIAESYSAVFNYLKAATYYERYLISSSTVDSEILFNYSQCLISLGKTQEAKKVMEEYGNCTDNPLTQNHKCGLYKWVENSDKDGPFITTKTNIDIGERFSGMYFTDSTLYYSIPYTIKIKDITSGYMIVKSTVKAYSPNTIGKPEEVKITGSNNYNNNSVSFDKNNNIYFSTNSDIEYSEKTPFTKSLGGTYYGIEMQTIKTAQNIDGDYSEITTLPFCNEKYSYTHSYFYKEQNTMYFVSNMPGGYGGFDIYSSKLSDKGEWSEPKNLGSNINTIQNEMFPFVNNKQLYFSSFGHYGFGGADIFVSNLTNNEYSLSENMGRTINSNVNDLGIFFTDNKNTKGYVATSALDTNGDDNILYFEKSKPDTINVYTIMLKSENDSIPVSLFKKDGNKFRLTESKIAKKEGVNFTLDKGITYKIVSEINYKDSLSKLEFKIDPKNRSTDYTIYPNTIAANTSDSTEYYIYRYSIDNEDYFDFENYVRNKQPEIGTYIVSGAFEYFKNAVNNIIISRKNNNMNYSIIRYVEDRKMYFNMILIKDINESEKELRAIKTDIRYNDAWIKHIKNN
ncbi:MAG: hypothetical protein KAG96_07310 [Ichthyobacteriaceae bacterium]|nr:hypothetical protein [Ichthyobacteriaceae bacterium]